MNIAVLSGKGGTGKTLVAVNLAAVASSSLYMDCDVEEPNGYLFFKPNGLVEEEIVVKIPQIDVEKCIGCRQCVDFCNFNALAYVKDKVIIFDDICHSCGGCTYICPENAITEVDKPIGKIQEGNSRQVRVCTGVLNTGEASGVPIIKKMFENHKQHAEQLTFIDCPPGSACTVMESIKDASYCILVAEPTVFGAHNLNMVYELIQLFDKPFGVILNKCLDAENPSEIFCIEKNINIIGKIPFDDQLGKLNSKAEISVWEEEKYKRMFSELLEIVLKEARCETITYS